MSCAFGKVTVDKNATCNICLDPPTNPVGHLDKICKMVACRDCLIPALKQDSRCPLCKTRITSLDGKPVKFVKQRVAEHEEFTPDAHDVPPPGAAFAAPDRREFNDYNGNLNDYDAYDLSIAASEHDAFDNGQIEEQMIAMAKEESLRPVPRPVAPPRMAAAAPVDRGQMVFHGPGYGVELNQPQVKGVLDLNKLAKQEDKLGVLKGALKNGKFKKLELQRALQVAYQANCWKNAKVLAEAIDKDENCVIS